MHSASRKPRIALFSLIAFTLALFCTLPGIAQTFRGGINGTVTDHTGAAIADATVIVGGRDVNLEASLRQTPGQHLNHYAGTTMYRGYGWNHVQNFHPAFIPAGAR